MEWIMWAMQLMGALRPWMLLFQVLVLLAVLIGDPKVQKRIRRGVRAIAWQVKKGARRA